VLAPGLTDWGGARIALKPWAGRDDKLCPTEVMSTKSTLFAAAETTPPPDKSG
jgi:hypothetical protein